MIFSKKHKHSCSPSWVGDKNNIGLYGIAVSECNENEDGNLWAGNGEYETRVNFCPFCGEKARRQIKTKRSEK